MPEQKKRERLWKSRPLRPGDEASLLELTEACTGKTITLDQWRWLFERNPGGKGVFRLGDHDGRLAGQYVILRQRMMIDGRETPGAQSLETMTHPDYRRYGLATQAMEDAQRKMAADGHHIGLLTTRIQDFYRKLGWESAGRERCFTLDRGNIGVLGDEGDLEVTENWYALASTLNDLHLREPVTSLRDPVAFRLLMERKARRVFVGLRNGETVAYVAVRGTSVIEYAGGLDDVRAALRSVFAHLDDPEVATSERPAGRRATIEMQVMTPDAEEGLPGFLMAGGIPRSLSHPGMIRVLDPGGLFEALDIRGIAVSTSGAGWQLSWGQEVRSFSARDTARLLFGPERVTDPVPEGLPVDFYQWTADRV